MLVCGLCVNAGVCFRLLRAFRFCYQNGSLLTTHHGLPPLMTISRISRSGRRNITLRMSSRNFGLMPCFLYYKNRLELPRNEPHRMLCNLTRLSYRRPFSLGLLSHCGCICFDCLRDTCQPVLELVDLPFLVHPACRPWTLLLSPIAFISITCQFDRRWIEFFTEWGLPSEWFARLSADVAVLNDRGQHS